VLAAKDREIRERDNQIQNLQEQVGILGRQLEMAGVQVRRLQNKKFEELQEKDQELQQKDEVVQEMNTQLELQSQELYQKNQELDQKNRELQEKDRELGEKDHLLQQLQLQLVSQDSLRQATPTSFTYNISGAGVETANVKTPSQFSSEVLYSQGGPCSSSPRVTAELKSTTSSQSQRPQWYRNHPPPMKWRTLPPLKGGMSCV